MNTLPDQFSVCERAGWKPVGDRPDSSSDGGPWFVRVMLGGVTLKGVLAAATVLIANHGFSDFAFSIPILAPTATSP